jgi:hypothetical protein
MRPPLASASPGLKPRANARWGWDLGSEWPLNALRCVLDGWLRWRVLSVRGVGSTTSLLAWVPAKRPHRICAPELWPPNALGVLVAGCKGVLRVCVGWVLGLGGLLQWRVLSV